MPSEGLKMALIVLGVVAAVVGFATTGPLWSDLRYLGASWILAGVVYFYARRKISDGGFMAALFLGVIGAVAWVVLDMRSQNTQNSFEP
jgi:hypothetical protein